MLQRKGIFFFFFFFLSVFTVNFAHCVDTGVLLHLRPVFLAQVNGFWTGCNFQNEGLAWQNSNKSSMQNGGFFFLVTLTFELDLHILPLDLHAKIQVRMSVRLAVRVALAYRSKGCILVEVLPVPNAYTTL